MLFDSGFKVNGSRVEGEEDDDGEERESFSACIKDKVGVSYSIEVTRRKERNKMSKIRIVSSNSKPDDCPCKLFSRLTCCSS